MERVLHELHRRRRSRNVGVGLALVAFVAVIFGLTIAKLERGQNMEGFDHTPRPALVEPQR